MKYDKLSFNGIQLYQEPTKIERFSDTAQFKDSLGNGKVRAKKSLCNKLYSYDELNFLNNGLLDIGGAKYRMFDNALFQLLNLLGIPTKFARKIPADLLMLILNRYMSESFDTQVNVRMNTKDTIFSITPSSVALESSHFVFSKILDETKLTEMGCNFYGAIVSGWTSIAILSLAEIENEDDKMGYPAIEIMYSDAGQCKPTISGIIMSMRGIAVIPNLTFKIDGKLLGDQQIVQSMQNAILKVKNGINKYVEQFNNMKNIKITKNINKILLDKSSKMLPNKIKDLEGRNFDSVLDEIADMRKSKEWTIWERRNMSQYIGRMIESIF